MKQKHLHILAVLVALLLPFNAWADVWQDPATKVNYEYTPGGKTAKVMAGSSNTSAGSPDATGNISIQAKITVDGNEYAVTAIAGKAFYNNNNITSVTIPEGITWIGPSAFAGCKQLSNTVLSASVDSLDSSSFFGCESLSSIDIPEGVIYIGSWAFNSCSSLNNVTLPSTLEYISYDSFEKTPWYETRYTAADDGLFYIDGILFGYKGTKPTGTVNIKEGTKVIARLALNQCSDVTEVNFPSSLKSIGANAFVNCNITSITIPASVTYLSCTAFGSSLTSINITDLDAWCKIKFAHSASILQVKHFLNGKEITNLVIPESVTEISPYAFSCWKDLKSVMIPATVCVLGQGAFGGCEELTDITCGADIGRSAFAGCTALTNVTLLEGVTKIDGFAFSECENLTTISVPASLTTVDPNGSGTTFYHCNITNIHVTDLAAWCQRTYRLTGLWSSQGP